MSMIPAQMNTSPPAINRRRKAWKKMEYTTLEKVQKGFRALNDNESERAAALIEEAAIKIDAIAPNASTDAKDIVSRNMVRRAIGAKYSDVPVGATQGSMSALGYTQSWTIGGGSNGELYFSKEDRRLLGVGNRIGSYSPLEDLL